MNYFLKNFYNNNDSVNKRFENFLKGKLNYNDSILFKKKLGHEYIDHLSSQVIDKQFSFRKLPKKVEKLENLKDKILEKVIIEVGGESVYQEMLELHQGFFEKNGGYKSAKAKKIILKNILKNERDLSTNQFETTSQSPSQIISIFHSICFSK